MGSNTNRWSILQPIAYLWILLETVGCFRKTECVPVIAVSRVGSLFGILPCICCVSAGKWCLASLMGVNIHWAHNNQPCHLRHWFILLLSSSASMLTTNNFDDISIWGEGYASSEAENTLTSTSKLVGEFKIWGKPVQEVDTKSLSSILEIGPCV